MEIMENIEKRVKKWYIFELLGDHMNEIQTSPNVILSSTQIIKIPLINPKLYFSYKTLPGILTPIKQPLSS